MRNQRDYDIEEDPPCANPESPLLYEIENNDEDDYGNGDISELELGEQ